LLERNDRNDQYEQVIGKEHANFLFYFNSFTEEFDSMSDIKDSQKVHLSLLVPHLSMARVGINLAQTKFLN